MYVPENGSSEDQSDIENDDFSLPDILNPSKLFEAHEKKQPHQFAKVNKQPILNLITKSMKLGDN